MSKATVIFTHNEKQAIVPCITNEKLDIICQRFITKVELDISKIYYYTYNGKMINKELSFEEQADKKDKMGNQMNIIVVDENNKKDKNKNIKESYNIIYPECKNNILIKMEEYRINNYKKKDISIKEFDNTQSKIICDICKVNNQSIIYKCITCGNTICSLCKSKHDNKHIIVKYEEKNIICNKHNEKYIKYCNNCNKTLCMECIKELKNPNDINFQNTIADADNNEYIDKLIRNINEIILKLEDIKENMKIYSNKNNNIINNKKKKIFEMLEKIKEYNIYNDKIIENIKEIINEKEINNKFKNVMNMHNKINYKNIIIAEIDIKEDDLNKDIRIINSFEQCKRELNWKDNKDDYKYENEKEIKENCIIKINNIIIPFDYFHKFNKIGKYKIEYSFLCNLTKTNFLFYECKSLININLSNFNSQNVTNMNCMFSDCRSLTKINLSNFNTQNINDMSCMFSGCQSLKNIDLSNFNTENVNDMSYMFNGCRSLKKKDVITKDIKILKQIL